MSFLLVAILVIGIPFFVICIRGFVGDFEAVAPQVKSDGLAYDMDSAFLHRRNCFRSHDLPDRALPDLVEVVTGSGASKSRRDESQSFLRL